jgi:uncharacterized protein Veg
MFMVEVKMTQTVNVRFSYGDKVSQEIPIHLGVDIDLSTNKNRKRLLNRLLKSNSNITEVSILSSTK